MKKFSTVEDYLEVIAGRRDIETGVLKPASWMGVEFKPIVSLARYDVSFLDNVTTSTLSGNALTDKQAELSVKIVTKYRKQLNSMGVEVFEEGFAQYRKPIRLIDRTKSISIENEKIVLRFPYETRVIELIRAHTKNSQGKVIFNKSVKAWEAALTEYNLSWIVAFGESNNFDISDRVKELMALILECEQNPWSMELAEVDGVLTITNAPDSMLEWIATNLGSRDDLRVCLADYASVLGYDISPRLVREIEQKVGSSVSPLVFNRTHEIRTDSKDESIQRVLAYAELTNRWPVVVFDPTGDFTAYRTLFDPEQVIDLLNKRTEPTVGPQHRVILTNRAIKNMNTIPLLISHIGMIAGQDKKIMTDAAEKTVYLNCYKLGQ